VFLMASKKRPKNKTSNYLISMGKFVGAFVFVFIYQIASSLCLHILICVVCSSRLRCADQNDLNRTGKAYLGKLRSNFVGTEFQIFDNGLNPKDAEPDEASYSSKLFTPLLRIEIVY
jgi:hypothetical protein